MNEPIGAKKPPEVKSWVRRVVEAAGVFMPENADGERRLGWWGIEMARFLKFCKTLPPETAMRSALEGYGRYLKSSVPPPQDWQMEQAREALRCFQKGTENWHIAAPDEQGRVEVGFRVKTRSGEAEGEEQRAERMRDGETGRQGERETGRREAKGRTGQGDWVR